MALFNINAGYLDGICRGMRNSMLSNDDYNSLAECITLEDLVLHLNNTEIGNISADLCYPLTIASINEVLWKKLINQFHYIRNQSVEPLSNFLDFISYSYMIDNIIFLLMGIVNNKPISELLKKCHPLGIFDEMRAINLATSPTDLYNAVLIDTPLAQFVTNRITELDFKETNVEILKNLLHKQHIETFYKFCKNIGGTTGDVMCEILSREADRRSIMITYNSFYTELKPDERAELFPNCGFMYPEGIAALAVATERNHVKQIAECYIQYADIFDEFSTKFQQHHTIEDRFILKEVQLNKLTFIQSFHYGVFYAYFKLKEQEIRNIVWMGECIILQKQEHMKKFISTSF